MKIRRANSQDVDELVRLRLLAVTEGKASPSVTHEFVTATRDYLAINVPEDDPLLCWVAEVDRAIISTASLIRFQRMPNPTNPTGREGYVSNIFTDRPCRRQGIASSLLVALVDEAKRQGIRRLWLFATDEGKSIYQQLGFVDKRRREAEMELTIFMDK